MARKSFTEELGLFRRYSELTEPFFKVLSDHFKSRNKADRRWAAERLERAFVKMLPQDIDVTTKGKSLNLLSDIEKAKLLALLHESESSR